MKNCPFCNEVMWATDLKYHPGPGLWAPVCGNCNARGPLHGHKHAAMEAWDKAATQRDCLAELLVKIRTHPTVHIPWSIVDMIDDALAEHKERKT